MSAERLFDLFNIMTMKAMGVFIASLSGVSLVQFPSYYDTEVAFEANKVSATGTVLATREETHYSGGGGYIPLNATTRYISTVQFQTLRGKSVEFTTGGACSSRKDCDLKTVRVQYDPNVPCQARIYSHAALNVRVGVYVVLCLVFFLFGVGMLLVNLDDRPTRSNN